MSPSVLGVSRLSRHLRVFQVSLGASGCPRCLRMSPGAPNVSVCLWVLPSVLGVSVCLQVLPVSPGALGVPGVSGCPRFLQLLQVSPGVSRCFRCSWCLRVFQASCSAARLSSSSWVAEALPGQLAYVVSPASPGPSLGTEEFHLVALLFLSHDNTVLLLQHQQLLHTELGTFPVCVEGWRPTEPHHLQRAEI